MIDPKDVPSVDDDEMLARYILAGEKTKSLRKLVRPDETIKPQLFMPYPHRDLSVNRHRDCSEDEIWSFGKAVAAYRDRTFHGRSDISVADCALDSLEVLAKPIPPPPDVPANPNHADIVGFAEKKEDQLSLAAKLAERASERKPMPTA